LRKFNNEKVYDVQYMLDIICREELKEDEMGGSWGTYMGKKINIYRVLTGKCEGNNHFEV
jgi:hypothetical protein